MPIGIENLMEDFFNRTPLTTLLPQFLLHFGVEEELSVQVLLLYRVLTGVLRLPGHDEALRVDERRSPCGQGPAHHAAETSEAGRLVSLITPLRQLGLRDHGARVDAGCNRKAIGDVNNCTTRPRNGLQPFHGPKALYSKTSTSKGEA